jgi:hypothetical protein
MRDNPILPEVFVTKYALTRGIIRYRDVEHCKDISPQMISIRTGFPQAFHGNDWYTTLDTARAHVAEMIQARVRSLEKKLKEIKALSAENVRVKDAENSP